MIEVTRSFQFWKPYLKEEVAKLAATYEARSGENLKYILAAISSIASTLIIEVFEKHKQTDLMDIEELVDNLKPQPIFGECSPRLANEDNDRSMIDQHLGNAKDSCGISPKFYSLLNSTAKTFAAITKKLDSGELFSTTNPEEVRAIRMRTMSASCAVYFSMKPRPTTGFNTIMTKVLDSVDHLPAERPTTSEEVGIEAICSLSNMNFTHNHRTFAKGIYSGTPDAVFLKDGEVSGVGECKSDCSATEINAQMSVYCRLFGLQVGFYYRGGAQNGQASKFIFTDTLQDQLDLRNARFEAYKIFCSNK